MATVLFWESRRGADCGSREAEKLRLNEKPGCINNARQKCLLEQAGHTLEVRDLLAEPWTPESLRPFFGHLPVADWFNHSAPAVKGGRVLPECLDEETALALMVRNPLLIRRPLMQVGGERRVGFMPEVVSAWIGLRPAAPAADLVTCPRSQAAQPGACP